MKQDLCRSVPSYSRCRIQLVAATVLLRWRLLPGDESTKFLAKYSSRPHIRTTSFSPDGLFHGRTDYGCPTMGVRLLVRRVIDGLLTAVTHTLANLSSIWARPTRVFKLSLTINAFMPQGAFSSFFY